MSALLFSNHFDITYIYVGAFLQELIILGALTTIANYGTTGAGAGSMG